MPREIHVRLVSEPGTSRSSVERATTEPTRAFYSYIAITKNILIAYTSYYEYFFSLKIIFLLYRHKQSCYYNSCLKTIDLYFILCCLIYHTF